MPFSKQIVIFIVQIFFCTVCFAQTKTIDSLKNILPLLKDTARIDCLLKISFEYGHMNSDSDALFVYVNSDSATFYSNKALIEAKQLHYLKGMANAFENMGEMANTYDLHEGEKYFKQAILLYNNIHDYENLNWSYLWLGFYLTHQCKFNEARFAFDKALAYYQRTNNEAKEARTYGLFADSYSLEGYYTKAFEYCLKDIAKIQKNNKYKNDPIVTSLSLGDLYQTAGDTITALQYYRQSAGYSKTYRKQLYYGTQVSINLLENDYDSALYYCKLNDSSQNNLAIGEIYLLKKDYVKALLYLLKPLTTAKRQNNIYNVMVLLDDIAKAYEYQKKFDLSLKYATVLLATAKSNHARQFIKDGNWLIWKNYSQKNITDSAYKYRLLYDDINDSIASDELSRNIAVAEMKAKETQKQTQIDLLKKDNQINQQQIKSEALQKNIFILGLIIAVIIGFMIFRTFTLKRKAEKLENQRVQAELQQKTTDLELQALRAQMNPHFIFNCLNSINRFIIKNDAAKAADYLTKFAKLIRNVLEQSGKSFVPLEDEIKSLQLYMDLEALRFEVSFKYKINLNDIDSSTLMIPTMLIQPFVENAIWHGLHPKQNGIGEININMHQYNNTLHCTICDNGVGIKNSDETNQNKKKSLGINLTQQRLQLINSDYDELFKIKVEEIKNTDEQISGTCVSINIPLKND